MELACCAWALDASAHEGLKQVADMGFKYADLRPDLTLPMEQILGTDLAMKISCVAAAYGQPESSGLDRSENQVVVTARTYIEKALEQAATWGATVAYLVPEADSSAAALRRYGDELSGLAEYAAARGIKLGVEHFPGCALPTVTATLDFIRAVDHPNLYLLMDLGHVQISAEDPVKAVEAAGEQLAYVHLDDNDGCNDQHLGLLDGVLTQEVLQTFIGALAANDYQGMMSLELNAALDDPKAALARSREAVWKAATTLGLDIN